MKTDPSKLSDVRLEMQRVGERYVEVVYTRAITWNLTTSGHTGLVRWHMCQLGWLVATRIELGSLLATRAY